MNVQFVGVNPDLQRHIACDTFVGVNPDLQRHIACGTFVGVNPDLQRRFACGTFCRAESPTYNDMVIRVLQTGIKKPR
ncbi:hypothetical protein [Pseudoalteromonas sp. T1lg10]|uniref:hypothetical protein n=1 Tax=Pseudoalteromonas sp. T1lg10 TaxID=2077093 RepID=UPI001F2C03AA|nr:hypothetical protein [Pseudoalteromonas sp. T1lg10]